MNWAWLDGKVTEHWMKDEHPLDGSAPRIAEGLGTANGKGNGHGNGNGHSVDAGVEKEKSARDSGETVLAGLKSATKSPEGRDGAEPGEAKSGDAEIKPAGNGQTGL